MDNVSSPLRAKTDKDDSITFTSDGNADMRPSLLAPELMLINQDKYAKLGKIALEFKRYQEVSHSLLHKHMTMLQR